MDILVISRNYPNNIQKTRGTFVASQVFGIKKLYAENYNFVVISPIGYLPNALNYIYSSVVNKISLEEVVDNLKIFYPRWFVLPKNSLKIIYPFFLWRSINKIIKLKNISSDVIHAHFCYPDGVVGYYLAKQRRKPLIITAHTGSIHILNKKFYWKYFMKDAFSYASKIIAVSPRIKNELISFGIKSDKITVIPNIIPQHFINKEKSIRGSQIIKLISIGNLVWLKGFDYLIKAVSILINQGIKIELTIVGNGELKQPLIQLAKEEKIESKVNFIGSVLNSDLPDLYNKHDIFVSSSLIESFGVVVFEALAVGLPVVVTKSGGPEQFITSELGEIVEKSNEILLAEGIIKVISKLGDYDISYLKNFVTSHFSERAVSEKIVDVYKLATSL